MVFVIHDQGFSTGHSSRGVTVFVVDKNLKIVPRNDLFDQDICAVFLEAVILAIKCQIMRISPATTDTFAFIVETAASFIVNPDWWVPIFTYRDGRFFTWHMFCYYFSILTCFCGAVV